MWLFEVICPVQETLPETQWCSRQKCIFISLLQGSFTIILHSSCIAQISVRKPSLIHLAALPCKILLWVPHPNVFLNSYVGRRRERVRRAVKVHAHLKETKHNNKTKTRKNKRVHAVTDGCCWGDEPARCLSDSFIRTDDDLSDDYFTERKRGKTAPARVAWSGSVLASSDQSDLQAWTQIDGAFS